MNFLKIIFKISIFYFMFVNNPILKAEITEGDSSKIFSGEVVVKAVKNTDGLSGVQTMFIVTATRNEIWKVLIDYDHFPAIFDGIDKIKVIKEDDQGAFVEFWINAVLKKLHYVLYRYYEKPEYKLTWYRLSGDLKKIEGSWEIYDTHLSDVKLLSYNSYVQPGGIIPTKLVRWGAIRKARNMGFKLRKWITEHK